MISDRKSKMLLVTSSIAVGTSMVVAVKKHVTKSRLNGAHYEFLQQLCYEYPSYYESSKIHSEFELLEKVKELYEQSEKSDCTYFNNILSMSDGGKLVVSVCRVPECELGNLDIVIPDYAREPKMDVVDVELCKHLHMSFKSALTHKLGRCDNYVYRIPNTTDSLVVNVLSHNATNDVSIAVLRIAGWLCNKCKYSTEVINEK